MTDEQTSDQPEQWEKRQMETDDPGETPDTRTEDATAPQWNKGTLAEEREDGGGGPHAEPVDPSDGLSGGGSNPGGGERWADRDR